MRKSQHQLSFRVPKHYNLIFDIVTVVAMKTDGYWDVTPCSHINILLPNSVTSHPRSRNLQQISLIKNPNSHCKFSKKTKKKNILQEIQLIMFTWQFQEKLLFCQTSYKWTTEMIYIKLDYYLPKNTKAIPYYHRTQK